MSSASSLLAQRSDLLVAVDQFAVWPEGVRFNLSVRLQRVNSSPVSLTFTPHTVSHEGEAAFRLKVTVDDDAVLDAFGDHASTSGFSLSPLGGDGTYGQTEVGRWDATWWLAPLPVKRLAFQVSCATIGLEWSEGVVDASDFSVLANGVVRL